MAITVFVVLATLGLIAPNATTLALTNAKIAGSAVALFGALRLVIGALAAPLAGLVRMTSAVPMAVTIAVVGIASADQYGVFCVHHL